MKALSYLLLSLLSFVFTQKTTAATQIETSYTTNASRTVARSQAVHAGVITFDAARVTDEDLVTATNAAILFIVTSKSDSLPSLEKITLLADNSVVGKHVGPLPPASILFFEENLVQGKFDTNVLRLQKYLNAKLEKGVASEGPGSKTQETCYFGDRTRRAMEEFQLLNELPVTGALDDETRAFINRSNFKENYVLVWVYITERVALNRGSVKKLDVIIETSLDAFGVLLVGMGDPTDNEVGQKNFIYATGPNAGQPLTENFNPTEGSYLLVQVPRSQISISPFGEMTIIGSAGESVELLRSSNLVTWTLAEKIPLPWGVTTAPINRELSSQGFYKVSAPKTFKPLQ